MGITVARMNAEQPWTRAGASASTILVDPEWPAHFPLTAEHLRRIDESRDTQFYAQPRIGVHHIDEQAQKALQAYYRRMLPKGGAVLDLMSSWTSHLAEGAGANREDGHFARLSITGISEPELRANPGAHDYHAHDINQTPSLAHYEDDSFDAVRHGLELRSSCVPPPRVPTHTSSATSAGPSACLTAPGLLLGQRRLPRPADARVRRDPQGPQAGRSAAFHVVQPHVPHQGDHGVAPRK